VLALVVLVVAVGLGFLAGGGTRGQARASGRLTVTASGSSWVKPNQAQINLGAQETEPTAPAALQKLSSVAARLLKAVAADGIKPSQVQTSNLNLGQNYGPNGQPQGYQASEQFTVTTQDLGHLGTVVTAATSAGANQLNSLQLMTADPNAGQQQAVQAALKAAKKQAAAEASELGVTLGTVQGVSVSSSQTPVPIMFSGAHAAASAAAPIATGNQQVQVSVQVTYSFR
jgi:uncharacterized protein YggE